MIPSAHLLSQQRENFTGVQPFLDLSNHDEDVADDGECRRRWWEFFVTTGDPFQLHVEEEEQQEKKKEE